MKTVAFVPAKGSSERIPNKNLRLLDGKPLVLYTIEKLLRCREVDEVVLDSDSDEVLDLAAHLPCRRMKREAGLASNRTDGHELFMNQVESTDADLVVQVLCTSPFLKAETVDLAVRTLKDDPQYDSALLMCSQKLYQWKDGKPLYGTGRIPNSVDLEATQFESMGMYVVRRPAALRDKRRFGANPFMLFATPMETVDVNNPEDLELASLIASGIRERENSFFKNLVSHLNSAMLSDILDELGVKGVVTGLKPNLPGASLLGRAKTLKIRRATGGDDWKSIYGALESYSQVGNNDVIVVENEVADYAYFGELNCLMARRAGASGAIIDGQTRDSSATTALGFPVFARGNVCHDVRGRAALESINRPVMLGDVRCSPGDLVFADQEGVIVLPATVADEVIRRAVSVLANEWQIKMDIALNRSAQEILDARGTF